MCMLYNQEGKIALLATPQSKSTVGYICYNKKILPH